jgi:hypothetical protein
MKKLVIQLIAIAVGALTVLLVFQLLKKSRFAEMATSPPNSPLEVIGEMTSVDGQVERRLAGSVRFESIPGPRSLFSKDLLVTQKSSFAILSLHEGERTETAQLELRLNESSKFVVEFDGSKPGALIGTLLGGTITVIKPGKPGLFRLFREGREIAVGSSEIPNIPVVSQPPIRAGSPSPTAPMGLVITATRE